MKLFGEEVIPILRRAEISVRAAADREKQSMAQRTRPPFRADHVGSLIRPQELREARQAHLAGKLAARNCTRIEDRLIREAVAMQERVGLQVDHGRRVPPHLVPRGVVREHRRLQQGARRDRFLVLLRRRQHAARDSGAQGRRAAAAQGSMAADDFKFLKTATKATPKVMLPAPSLAHWFVGDKVFAGAYADAREYMADIARIFREEIAELASLGCTYVQIDEVPIPVICDPQRAGDHRKPRRGSPIGAYRPLCRYDQ